MRRHRESAVRWLGHVQWRLYVKNTGPRKPFVAVVSEKSEKLNCPLSEAAIELCIYFHKCCTMGTNGLRVAGGVAKKGAKKAAAAGSGADSRRSPPDAAYSVQRHDLLTYFLAQVSSF